MASTHLVFTTANGRKVSLPKATCMVYTRELKEEVETIICNSLWPDDFWIAKETFDELLKQLEE
jgi:hypothetical protein